MSLFTASLNSGSNGNCYYIGNGIDAVLVDVGISCREIEKRMARLGLSMSLLKAIFITHEHADHIRGVVVLARKYKLPVYITKSTLKNSPISLEEDLVRSFTANEPIPIGKLTITPFVKVHDAKEPHSFIVEGNGIKIGVITDIGIACEQVIHNFKQCHAAFLEANYDEEMLEQGRYPQYLKDRIRSGKGHISNKQALELFVSHKPGFMTHLFLSHLSKDNNCPEHVHELFMKHSGNTHITVASRYKESEVYHITNQKSEKLKVVQPKVKQMSLF